jgi:uncharacterized lipoprotein YddW (UPF0748 family)
MKCFWLAAVVVLIAPLAAAQEETLTVLDADSYPSNQAAQAAWKIGEKNTPLVEQSLSHGHPVLKLPCNFAANDAWRVCWDRHGHWDLSSCQTIRVELTVDRDRPVDMILYFHSGHGWYGRPFTAVPGPSTIELARAKFGAEEKPGGWDKIDTIRVSVSRDEAEDRLVLLGPIVASKRPGKIVIYRNDAGVRVEDGVPHYVAQMSDRLTRLGLPHDVFGDDEIAAGRLKGFKVAILPLNPAMPKASAAALEKFVAAGGKLVVCYCLPAPLDKILGLKKIGAMQGQERLFAFKFERYQPARGTIGAIQQSWWATRVEPLSGTRVRGTWIDKAGRPSNEPAVTSNPAGIFIGHVLTDVDAPAKDWITLEILGELWPGLWKESYEARLKRLGHRAGFAGAAEMIAAVRANMARSGNLQQFISELDKFEAIRVHAEDAAKSEDFPGAIGGVALADQTLLEAYAASISARPGEFRAVWCHSPHGVAGMTWDEAIERLADAGFTAILPNMAWGGSAAFDSKVLPRGIDIPRDRLAECLAAAKKHGIAVHVWKVNWNLWSNCPPAFKAELRRAGRLQSDPAGTPIDWLCPSHPENQKLELDSLVDLAARYEIAGIHFDYIRYPGDNGCFCLGCRQRFEEQLGRKVEHWPADVTEGPLVEPYRQFRRENITRLVAAVSREARKIRPGLKISAAVFWHWSNARNSVAQDWKLWVEKGYLDFVCPMQYTDSAAAFAGQTRLTAGWTAGKIPLVPGIGATLGLSPDGTLEQVLAARRQAGTAGFVLFNYDLSLLEHLDLLRLGATRK